MDRNQLRSSLEAYRNDLQKRMAERINRPTMTESLHEQNKKSAERKASPLFSDFRTDKATYLVMAISGVFTGLLGLILGLAPYTVTAADGSKSIYFNTDFLHWVIAVVYMVAFITVTEAAFMIAKNKFHNREEGNIVQQGTMLAMMLLAGVSIIGTGVAGGSVGASVLGFLSDFREIPHSAQVWVVRVIPVLLSLYAFLLVAYKLSSEEEKSNRLAEQFARQQQLEHKLNRRMTDLDVEEMMMLAEDQAYLELVQRGVLSAAEAFAARRAGKTLGQLEKERGVDLNGDGMIGERPTPKRDGQTQRAPVYAAPVQRSEPSPENNNGHNRDKVNP